MWISLAAGIFRSFYVTSYSCVFRQQSSEDKKTVMIFTLMWHLFNLRGIFISFLAKMPLIWTLQKNLNSARKVQDLPTQKMFHLKETALRDKFENFRQSLDSNYNSSHSKLSDKLNELTKEVNSLKDNLSKSVRKAMQAKNKSEKTANTQEGKFYFRSSSSLHWY